jgi:hypothetical protein
MMVTDAGPVRGVVIHPSRALLVTGGDDYKIRVRGQPPKLSGMVLSADIRLQIFDLRTAVVFLRCTDICITFALSNFTMRCLGL